MPTTEPIPTATPPAPAMPPPPTAGGGGGGGALLLGAVLIGAGALWLLAALGIDIPVAMVAPVLLVVLGLIVLASAVRGRDNAVLGFAIAVGVWVAIAAVITTLVQVPLAGAIGDRELVPGTAAAAEGPHRLFAGTQLLDLRALEAGAGPVMIEASTVLGEVEVLVPDDVPVRIEASVAAGAITLFGATTDGVDVDRTYVSDDWDEATDRLDLELRVGFGEVRVRTD